MPGVSRPSKPKPAATPEKLSAWVQAIGAITTIGDRFGVAFAVFVILLGSVWLLGSPQTRDDFLRELLFGSITRTRYLAFFFVLLLIIAAFGIDTKVKELSTESAEMKRVTNEKAYWQQVALDRPLSHTEDERDK